MGRKFRKIVKLTEKQQELAAKYAQFVQSYTFHAVRKYRLINKCDEDELESRLYLRLCTIAQEFKPKIISKKHNSFKAFMLMNLKRQIFVTKDYENRYRRYKTADIHDFNFYHKIDSFNSFGVNDFIPEVVDKNDIEQSTGLSVSSIQVDSLLDESGLTETELSIIRKIFYENQHITNIARGFKKNRNEIRNIRDIALKKLKSFIEENDYSYECFLEPKYEKIDDEIPDYRQNEKELKWTRSSNEAKKRRIKKNKLYNIENLELEEAV